MPSQDEVTPPTTEPTDSSTSDTAAAPAEATTPDEAVADPESSETPMPSGVAYVPEQSGQADSNGAVVSSEAVPAGTFGAVPEAVPEATFEEPKAVHEAKLEAVPEAKQEAVPEATFEATREADVTTVEPTAVEPTTVEPTAVEPTTVDAAPVGETEPSAVHELELSPGDVAQAPVVGLWPTHAAEALRERWHDLQLRFVDDPHHAAAQADFLVGEAIETLTGSLASVRTDLSDWRSEGAGDTERLRVAVRRYREFLDRILGL
jgi:hypothetical protein